MATLSLRKASVFIPPGVQESGAQREMLRIEAGQRCMMGSVSVMCIGKLRDGVQKRRGSLQVDVRTQEAHPNVYPLDSAFLGPQSECLFCTIHIGWGCTFGTGCVHPKLRALQGVAIKTAVMFF